MVEIVLGPARTCASLRPYDVFAEGELLTSEGSKVGHMCIQVTAYRVETDCCGFVSQLGQIGECIKAVLVRAARGLDGCAVEVDDRFGSVRPF